MGFVLTNRFLGDVFALHIVQFDVRTFQLYVGPVDSHELSSALWTFEPGKTDPNAYRIRNQGFSDRVLADEGNATLDDQDGLEWTAEYLRPFDTDVPTLALHPTNQPGWSLATHIAPPYFTTVTPDSSDPSTQWRAKSQYYCQPLIDAGSQR
jgi:hypothetical protein